MRPLLFCCVGGENEAFIELIFPCLFLLTWSSGSWTHTSTIKQIPPIRLHMFVPLPNLCRFFCFPYILAPKPFVFTTPWQSRLFPNRVFAHSIFDKCPILFILFCLSLRRKPP